MVSQHTVASSATSLVTLSDPKSRAAEAYRALRMNIEFASVDEPVKTLLVTSPGTAESKSTVLANLAVVMADGDNRVILVDADLRRPALHEIFGLPNEQGLTDMFRDDDSLRHPPLQQVGETNLGLLTSGPLPPIPAQLLNSKRLHTVLEKLASMADVVLFDAPPLMVVTDAALLASTLDGVLLVVRQGGTKRDHVVASKDRLEKVNARFLGVVLTDAAPEVGGARDYYA